MCTHAPPAQENDLLAAHQEEADAELQRLHRQLEEQRQSVVRLAHEEGTANMRLQQDAAQAQVGGPAAGPPPHGGAAPWGQACCHHAPSVPSVRQ